MKILIIHNKYQSNNIGGEDIVYKNELKSLQDELGQDCVFSYEVSNDDINKIKLIWSIWFSKEHYNKVRQIVKENSIDLVHIHNFFPLLTPSIFKASKISGAKVIHTLHNYRFWCISGIFFRDNYGVCELCTKNKFSIKGILNKCYRESFFQSIVAQFAFWYYHVTKIFDNIDYFFVLTNFQKKKVESLGINENRIILKPNSVNILPGFRKDKSGYIYVGRLEESKGIYALLNIWQKLGEKYVLTIIGHGKSHKKLKKEYISPNIIFKGKCSREDTLRYISQSKYLIQPSLWYETFGLTIIEAMSFGVPVIGLDIGTRGDFIQDGVNGFLSNEENLSEVIEKSFEYGDYNFLSKHSFAKAKEFENIYITKKQIQLYKKIIEGKV